MSEGLYKLSLDFGRSGYLEGIFIADKEEVGILTNPDYDIEIYFGEVLGKYSDIQGTIESSDISLISEDSKVLDIVKEHRLYSGYNPFKQLVTTKTLKKYSFDEDSFGKYTAKSIIAFIKDTNKQELPE